MLPVSAAQQPMSFLPSRRSWRKALGSGTYGVVMDESPGERSPSTPTSCGDALSSQAEQEKHHRGQHHRRREKENANRERTGQRLQVPHHVGAQEAAEVADRVD